MVTSVRLVSNFLSFNVLVEFWHQGYSGLKKPSWVHCISIVMPHYGVLSRERDWVDRRRGGSCLVEECLKHVPWGWEWHRDCYEIPNSPQLDGRHE